MISFLNEAMIYTLLGLLVPIVIHLLSNRFPKSKLFSSLQFMDEENAVQVRSLRFSEPLLFLLRVLTLLLLTLYLMNLIVNSETERTQHFVLIENSLIDDIRIQEILPEFRNEKTSIRSLEKEFPKIADSKRLNSVNYWHLLRDLNEYPLSEVTVISNQKRKNFPGKIPSYPFNLNFIPIDASEDISIHSLSDREDSLFLNFIIQTPQDLTFESQPLAKEMDAQFRIKDKAFNIVYNPINMQYSSNSEIIKRDSIEWIYFDKSLSALKPYFEAAFTAINKINHSKFKISKTINDQVHWYIGGASQVKSATSIRIKISESYESNFFKTTVDGFDLIKSPEINNASPVLQTAFVDELLSIVYPTLIENDHRQIHLEKIQAEVSNDAFVITQSYNQILLILLCLIIAIERFLSLKKGAQKNA